MKNIKSITLCGIFSLLIGLNSCENTYRTSTEPTSLPSIIHQLSAPSPDQIGAAHNSFMAYLSSRWNPDSLTWTIDSQRIAYKGILNEFYTDSTSGLTQSQINIYKENSVKWLDSGAKAKAYNSINSSSYWRVAYSNWVDSLLMSGYVSSSDQTFLLQTYDRVFTATSTSAAKDTIIQLLSAIANRSWHSNGGKKAAEYALTIGKYSAMFVIGLPNGGNEPPGVIAGDIAGALGGAGYSLVTSWRRNEPVDWGDVANAAGWGAFGASAGPIIGKVGKWLKSFF